MNTRLNRTSIHLAIAGFALVISPVIAQVAVPAAGPAPQPLGTVVVLTGEEACGQATCFDVLITTSETALPATASLKVNEPASLPPKGTILFLTGGKGSSYWEIFGPDARRVLTELRLAGYRTVQVKWDQGWLIGDIAGLEGPQQLASRSATLAQWIHDNLNGPDPGAAFCATGNSAGAAQIAYMLVDYGLADLLSAVVMTGGPPFSRLDLGCLRSIHDSKSFWYPKSGRVLVDRGFGYTVPGSGPCARGDAGFLAGFQGASLSPKHGLYFFPTTMAWFLFGDQDTTGSVSQGMVFYDEILKSGSLLAGVETIAATPHAVPSTRAGADRVRDLLLLDCHPR